MRLKCAYPVQRATVAEDEIDGALDEAVLEVMPAPVIVESVLVSVE